MEPFPFLPRLILFSKVGPGEISLEMYCLKKTEAPALRKEVATGMGNTYVQGKLPEASCRDGHVQAKGV